jgi:hypothetical protein
MVAVRDALGLSTGPVAAPLECDGWFLYRHTAQVLVKYELMPKP